VGSSSGVGSKLFAAFSHRASVTMAGRSNLLCVDLSSPHSEINLPEKTDVVINCAAAFDFQDLAASIDSAEVNVLGPLRLLEASARVGAQHFIQVSSIFASMPHNDVVNSPYAIQKRTADELLHSWGNSTGTLVTSLRASALYGQGGFQRLHQPFLDSIINNAAEGRDIVFGGRHDALRNYLHIDDFTSIVWETVSHRVAGIYDCPGTTFSYSQVAWSAVSAFGTGSAISFDLSKDSHEDKVPLIDDSLYRRLRFSPKIDLDQAMRIDAASRIAAK